MARPSARVRTYREKNTLNAGAPHSSEVDDHVARRAMGRFRMLPVAILAASVVAGCGTQTVIKTVTTTGAQPTTTSQTQAAGQSTQHASPQQAKVGDKLTLTGNAGESMAVTVDQVMDPLQVGRVDQPDPGQRYVGIQITLKNVGSAPYSDSPSNGATLLSGTNEQAQGQIVSGGPCGNGFQSSANIAPGDTQQGCLPFELTKGQTPGSFQFTLDSGFANQTGQWSLAGASTSTPSKSTSSGNSSPSSANSATASNTAATLPNECSRGLSATASVSCGLASNVFYEYYQAQQNGGVMTALSAWSSATKQYYNVSCSSGSGVITCAVRRNY